MKVPYTFIVLISFKNSPQPMLGTFHNKTDAQKFAAYYRNKQIKEKLKIRSVNIKSI